jgi:c-di-GMP-binding flagellar brake protein YcgR
LFSRKKNDPLTVSIDQERRSSFRVEPSPERPIYVSIGSDKYRLRDIGAGGMGICLRDDDKELESGKKYPFKMTLPLTDEVVSGTLRIVDIFVGVYHCRFIDLSKEEREKIHLFVLEREKEELREKKGK